ncbi:MAG: hypothetical protein WC464_04630 [Bdellovibrionales bacterium]
MAFDNFRQLWKISKAEICCAAGTVVIAVAHTAITANRLLIDNINTTGFMVLSGAFAFCAYRNFREHLKKTGKIVENDFWEVSKTEASLACVTAGLAIGHGLQSISSVGAKASIAAVEAAASSEITMGLALTSVLLAGLAKHRYDMSLNKKTSEASAPIVA